jgi:hypothetical protein
MPTRGPGPGTRLVTILADRYRPVVREVSDLTQTHNADRFASLPGLPRREGMGGWGLLVGGPRGGGRQALQAARAQVPGVGTKPLAPALGRIVEAGGKSPGPAGRWRGDHPESADELFEPLHK